MALGFACMELVSIHEKFGSSGEDRLTGLEANMQFTELQSLRMSNEWLKNRVGVLQEERAVLLDTAVADLDKKSMDHRINFKQCRGGYKG